MFDKKKVISDFIRKEISNIPVTVNKHLTQKDNNDKLYCRSEFGVIKGYIDDFLKGDLKNRYVVLPGLRGVGKTTLLFQLYDYLLKEKNIPANQILYFSCEDLNEIVECSVRELTDIFLENFHNTNLRLLDKKIFLLIDESQYDHNWSLSGKIIYDRSDEVFMIFTGSSALDLEYNADSARRMEKNIITPLNYAEHVKLNYNVDLSDLSKALHDLVFKGDNIEEAILQEKEANDLLINSEPYFSNDWDNFLRYGGFPVLYSKDSYAKLVNVTRKVINMDMTHFKNFSFDNRVNANRILRFMALKDHGDTSHVKLSNFLQTSSLNVKSILDVLEMTHLIFHIEPYGVSSKRISKAWRYYFATSSLSHSLSSAIGDSNMDSDRYEGKLLENLIASCLHNRFLKNFDNEEDYLFYDSKKKVNVDFVVRNSFNKPVPIEVGKGDKDKGQVKDAMNRFHADYGVVVSNKTNTIKQKGDVIFIPPKTFSCI